MSQQNIGGEIELFAAHSWHRSRPASEHLGSVVLTSVVCCTCATITGRSKLCYKINILACALAVSQTGALTGLRYAPMTGDYSNR